MKYPSRRQYKHAKVPYRVLNWPDYEAGLRRRGDITVWFSDDAIAAGARSCRILNRMAELGMPRSVLVD